MGKYIGWKSITTSLVLLALTGICSILYAQIKSELSDYADIKLQVQANTEQRIQNQEFKAIIQQIAIDVKGIKQRQLTVQGIGKVEDYGDEVCIKINVIGRAADYEKMERARITNVSIPEQPATTAKIQGTFRHADSNYIVMLSKRAGEDLHVEEDEVKIRLEPVEEE